MIFSSRKMLNRRVSSVQKFIHFWCQIQQMTWSFQSVLMIVSIGLIISLICPIVQYVEEASTQTTNATINSCAPVHGHIGILLYLDSPKRYNITLSSWYCYAQLHGYELFVVQAYFESLPSRKACVSVTSLFFRRHCIASVYLEQVDWLFFVDADSFVVNVNRCLEEFVDPNYHIVHYERFFSGEVAAGSYFVRNSPQGKSYLTKWYQKESILTQVNFHNKDNGILQLNVLAELEVHSSKIADCHKVFLGTNSLRAYFIYLGCTKRLLRDVSKKQWQQSNVKVLQPLHGWMRDGWLTNYYWSNTDFVLHGFKKQTNALLRYLTDPACRTDGIHTSPHWMLLWPTKHYFECDPPAFLNLIASTERRSERYHPDVFIRSIKIADCFPHCPPFGSEQEHSQTQSAFSRF